MLASRNTFSFFAILYSVFLYLLPNGPTFCPSTPGIPGEPKEPCKEEDKHMVSYLMRVLSTDIRLRRVSLYILAKQYGPHNTSCYWLFTVCTRTVCFLYQCFPIRSSGTQRQSAWQGARREQKHGLAVGPRGPEREIQLYTFVYAYNMYRGTKETDFTTASY